MRKRNSAVQRLFLFIIITFVHVTSFSNTFNQVKDTSTDYWVPKEPPKVHYRIECSVDPLQGDFNGKEIIHFKNTTTRPIRQFTIKWRSIKGQTLEITIDDKSVSVLKNPGSEISVIKLSDVIVPNAEIDVEAKFSASLPGGNNIDILPLVDWYPKLWWGFETHDDFDVKVDVPKTYKIATSGVLSSKSGYYHAKGIRSFGLVLLKDVDLIEAKAEDAPFPTHGACEIRSTDIAGANGSQVLSMGLGNEQPEGD